MFVANTAKVLVEFLFWKAPCFHCECVSYLLQPTWAFRC